MSSFCLFGEMVHAVKYARKLSDKILIYLFLILYWFVSL